MIRVFAAVAFVTVAGAVAVNGPLTAARAVVAGILAAGATVVMVWGPRDG